MRSAEKETLWYNSYTDAFRVRSGEEPTAERKSAAWIGFEEAAEIFDHPYCLDRRSDLPEQYCAIGWVGQHLYSLVFEVREDYLGEFYRLVTLWKSTREEKEFYAQNS